MTKVLGKTLITSEQIQKRTMELGRDISRDYAGKSVTLVAILAVMSNFTAMWLP